MIMSGSDAHLQDLRKELKKWESSFYFVHRRKPLKDDIDGAPKEIKDKYREYHELKTKVHPKTSEEPKAVGKSSSEVWGVEFNKTKSKAKDEDSLDKKDKSSPTALNDFGSKLFRSFSDAQQKLSKQVERKTSSKKSYFPKHPEFMEEKCESVDEPKKSLEPDGVQNDFKLSGDIFEKSKNMNLGKPSKPQFDQANLGLKFGAKRKTNFSNFVNTLKFDEDDASPHFDNNLSYQPNAKSPSVYSNSTKISSNQSEKYSKSPRINLQTPKANNASSLLLRDTNNAASENTDGSVIPHTTSHTTSRQRNSNATFEMESNLSGTDFVSEVQNSSNSADIQKGEILNEIRTDSDTALSLPKDTKPKQSKRGTKRKMQESYGISNSSEIDSKQEPVKHFVASGVTDDVSEETSCKVVSAPKRPKQLPTVTSKPVTASALSDNYVCLNMKRKRYKRKGVTMTGVKWKRKQWQSKMAAKRGSSSYKSNKCFHCGQEGHWAQKCPQKRAQYKPLENEEIAEVMDEEEILNMMTPGTSSQDDRPAPPAPCVPLCEKVEDIKVEMQDALSTFGLQSFRPGQEECITRILQGRSTLLILPTGCGKSLCYQLPAFLYAKHLKSVCLVVSPLLSLMEDQVSGLPPGVKGMCLHSNMTATQRDGVLTSLQKGEVHFLLVSPEAVVGGSSGPGSLPTPGRMPPIAFVCIDEAHCISEWSHNFRPSYLRLCKVLRQRYGVQCFLGLSATATHWSARDVVKHMDIEDRTEATIRGSVIPTNLVLSVSRDESKDEALINLLQGERFNRCPSVIIYCTRRDETSRVATLIRTSFQKSVSLESREPDAGAGKRKKKGTQTFDPSVWTVESYHAGMTAAQRKRVQKAFMSGRLRVVVATVAFGMGLDKRDVRAVIHYSMAKTFESYVQEIGRAGRDGQEAHCHVFLHPQVSLTQISTGGRKTEPLDSTSGLLAYCNYVIRDVTFGASLGSAFFFQPFSGLRLKV